MNHAHNRQQLHTSDDFPRPTLIPDLPAFERSLGAQLQIGDAILVGGGDPVSRFIQCGTQSEFSHMAVVTGPGELTEAYDYALTPDESDEGIYRLRLKELLGRSNGVKRIRVIRPEGVDQHRLVAAADHLIRHSPGFPTMAAACIAFCGLSVPFLKALPAKTRKRLVLWQIGLAADGVSRMHCAEAATRMYAFAGVQIRFATPRLQYHIGFLRHMDSGEKLLPLPTTERVAEKGQWPIQHRLPIKLATAVSTAITESLQVLGQRARSTEPVDRADLVMPGDFTRAEPFSTVGEWIRQSDGWRQAA